MPRATPTNPSGGPLRRRPGSRPDSMPRHRACKVGRSAVPILHALILLAASCAPTFAAYSGAPAGCNATLNRTFEEGISMSEGTPDMAWDTYPSSDGNPYVGGSYEGHIGNSRIDTTADLGRNMRVTGVGIYPRHFGMCKFASLGGAEITGWPEGNESDVTLLYTVPSLAETSQPCAWVTHPVDVTIRYVRYAQSSTGYVAEVEVYGCSLASSAGDDPTFIGADGKPYEVRGLAVPTIPTHAVTLTTGSHIRFFFTNQRAFY